MAVMLNMNNKLIRQIFVEDLGMRQPEVKRVRICADLFEWPRKDPDF